MKQLVLISLISLSSLAWSASEWKVVAETTSCDGNIQIMGKKGEKFVKAVHDGMETKLFSKDGIAFDEDSMVMNEFVSDKSSDVKYSYIQPSVVDGNHPKINVVQPNGNKRCRLNYAQ